jgi:hypothetical protein
MGHFAKAAQVAGWDTYGIEPDPKAARYARDQLKLNVQPVTLEQASFGEDPFDVVTLWDVLEHMPSPRHTLEIARNNLHHNGIMVLSIPNMSSWDRHIFKAAWIGWDPPRHLHLLTESNLQRLLNEMSMRIVSKKCLTGGKGAFLLSLDNVLAQRQYTKQLRMSFGWIAALTLPYRRLAYLLGRGPIITFAIEKTL